MKWRFWHSLPREQGCMPVLALPLRSGLTPRLALVALLPTLAKVLKEIARTCGVSLNTA
jgi:hypothetical protein